MNRSRRVHSRVRQRLNSVRVQSHFMIKAENVRLTNILTSDVNYLKKLRILIADDHGLLRRGTRTILQSHRGWRVVGEAADGREADRAEVLVQEK